MRSVVFAGLASRQATRAQRILSKRPERRRGNLLNRFGDLLAMAIRAFLEQSACVEQTIMEGDFHSAIAATIIACADCAEDNGGNDFEPPALRDARCRLLATTIACHMTQEAANDKLSNSGIKLLHGLLERRLLNWHSQGSAGQQDVTEELFGEEIYDGGRDSAPGQLTIADWVSATDISAAHQDWLTGKAKEVHAEKTAAHPGRCAV